MTPSTVSRALNGYTDIADSTRERVLLAAHRLNYNANVSARSLSSKTPPNIGLIMSGLLDTNPMDSIAHLLLQGVFGYALRNQLEIALYATDSKEQRRNSFKEFCGIHRLSGVVLSGISTEDPYLAELESTDIPVVSIDFENKSQNAGWVSIDNRAGMCEMCQSMIRLGHRQFLVLAGKKTAAVNEERMQGLADAWLAAGLEVPDTRVLYGDFSESIAYDAITDYLQRNGHSDFTCVICFSDIMAIGVLRALTDKGIQVPGEVSVTGFDDLPIASYTNPPLTTVRQDMRQFGDEAVRMLHQMMGGRQAGFHKVLPYQIVHRGSTAKVAPLNRGSST